MKKRILLLLVVLVMGLLLLVPAGTARAAEKPKLYTISYGCLCDLFHNNSNAGQIPLSKNATTVKKNRVKEISVISNLYRIFGKYDSDNVKKKKVPSGYKYEGCSSEEARTAVKWAISYGIVDAKTFKAGSYAKRAATINYFAAAINVFCPEVTDYCGFQDYKTKDERTSAELLSGLAITRSDGELKAGYTSKKDLSTMTKNLKAVLKNMCVALTGDYPVIETEHCYLLVDTNHVKLPDNAPEIIEDICNLLETETGLSFASDYYERLRSDSISAFFGANPWREYDEKLDKVKVFFTSDFKQIGAISNASGETVVLIAEDFFEEDGSMDWYPVCHELAHTLFIVNSGSWSRKMSEGNGMYYGQQIAKKLAVLHPEYVPGYNTQENYLGIIYDDKSALNATNARDIFVYGENNTITEYQYGFYLYTYLYESYGSSWISDYIAEINKRERSWQSVSPELEAKTLEKVLGRDFFKKFGSWYQKNLNRFDSYYME